MYSCIYYAHEDLDRPTDPKQLAKELGIDQKKCIKALTVKFTELQTGYRPAKKETSATQLIPELMTKLEFRNGFENAQSFSSRFDNDAELKGKPPQNVSAAILLYYLENHGFLFNQTEYPSIVDKKKATIDTVYRKVIAADARLIKQQ